jgi:hypothetical protein
LESGYEQRPGLTVSRTRQHQRACFF